MSKAPAFQLYAADFYMDTGSWTIEEVGIYSRLLFSQWVNGYIPNDPIRLARIAGCSTKSFQKWWPQIKLKFSVREDFNLVNLRLEETRKKQDEFINSRKKGGITRAAEMWKDHSKDSSAISSAISSANSSAVALQSSSSISSSNKYLKAEEPPVDNPPPGPIFPDDLPVGKEALEEKRKNAADRGKQEVQLTELAAAIFTKYPKFAFHTWLGKHTLDSPNAIIHTLESLLKQDDVDNPMAFCEAVLMGGKKNGGELARYNARDNERDHEVKKRPIQNEWANVGKVLQQAMAAKGG
ncbi:MAG: DUF1376 domain-containing protein [Patescibacteria group bacterium]|jgi:uncharacterized protein YdaU (DUF1376 family)